MLSGVCIGTNNIKVGYAGVDGKITLFILTPFNKEPASFGNGTQVMFYAPDIAAVDAFYNTALQNGGTDEGAPGPRDYHPNYYGAYVRDLDGNKLNVSIDLESSTNT